VVVSFEFIGTLHRVKIFPVFVFWTSKKISCLMRFLATLSFPLVFFLGSHESDIFFFPLVSSILSQNFFLLLDFCQPVILPPIHLPFPLLNVFPGFFT